MVLQKRLFQLGLLLIVINCMAVFSQEFYADSEINSINTSGQFRIKTENDNLIIQCYGEDEPLNIFVQYQIKKSEQNNFYIVLLIGIILIVSFVLVSFKRLNIFKNFKKKNIETRVIKKVKMIRHTRLVSDWSSDVCSSD